MPWENVLAVLVDEGGAVVVDQAGQPYEVAVGSVFKDEPPARQLLVGTQNRLMDQYRDSPNLLALFQALIDEPFQDLWQAVSMLRGRLDIDTMRGAQLDGIGQIVGQPRPQVLDFAESGDALEFKDIGDADDVDKAFSALSAPGQGGRFAGLTTNQFMGDLDYRVLLRAKILANTTAATIPDLEAYGSAVLGVPVRVVNGVGQISINVIGRVSPAVRGIFQETIAAAAGVQISDFVYGNASDAFAFDGPGGTGLGEIGTAQTGSGFARLLQST